MKMSARGAKLRVGQRDFAPPDCIRQFLQEVRGGRERKFVRIDHDSPAAESKSGPSIRFAENALGGQLASAHFLVAPEYIALWMGTLCEQTINYADCLHRLAIVNGTNTDTGFLLEVSEDSLGIDLVLSAIGYDIATRSGL